MAMVQIDALLREEEFQTRMILQVHDELLFEAPQEEKDRLVSRIRAIMEGVLPLRVRLKVDISAGPNWADMEKLAA
jgi:DNA polymerase-1